MVDGEGDLELGILLLVVKAGLSETPSRVSEDEVDAVSGGGGGGGGGCGVVVRGARRARRGSVAMIAMKDVTSERRRLVLPPD